MCGRGCEYGIVAGREFAHFLRGLMKFIHPGTSNPAEYEITALLKTVDRECADETLTYTEYFLDNTSGSILALNFRSSTSVCRRS